MLIPNPGTQEGWFWGRLSSWKNADSPTPSSPPCKYVPLLASRTFIFTALSLALCKIVSGEDEEEEGGKGDTDNILQKSLTLHSAVLITPDDFSLQGNYLNSKNRCSQLQLTYTWPGDKIKRRSRVLKSHKKIISPADSMCPHKRWGRLRHSDIFQEPDRQTRVFQWLWQLCWSSTAFLPTIAKAPVTGLAGSPLPMTCLHPPAGWRLPSPLVTVHRSESYFNRTKEDKVRETRVPILAVLRPTGELNDLFFLNHIL